MKYGTGRSTKTHEKTDGWLILWIVFFVATLAVCNVILALHPYDAMGQTWSRNIQFAWDANSEPDLLEYRLYQNDVQVAVIPAGTETAQIVIDQPGTYTWYLTAVDESINESLPSNSVTKTLDDVAPSQPQTITITITITVTP